MRMFFNPVLLSCLLSLFVLSDMAEAQRGRRNDSVRRNQRITGEPIQNPQPPGDVIVENSHSPVQVQQQSTSSWSNWQSVPANRLSDRTRIKIRDTISGIIDGHVSKQATARINSEIDRDIRSGKVKIHTNNSGVYRVTSDYGNFLLRPSGQVDWQF